VTALAGVAAYLPARRVPVAEVGALVGLIQPEIKVFQRYFGLREVRADPDGTVTDLLLGAARRLDCLRGQEQRVRYVLYARTVPVVTPYPVNPVHEVCARLGLSRAIAFSVTQHACASGLLAIDVAGRLLRATGDPDALALVLTGEKTFTREARFIPRITLMGEGAAACLVRAGGGRDELLAYAVEMRGEYDRLPPTGDLTTAFGREYVPLLIKVMRTACARAGLALDDLALVLPHNVNIVSWQRLCRDTGLPIERVLLANVPVGGHCFCADAFLNYRTALDSGLLRPGDHYLMAAVGTGATFSALVLRH
jgi:3-oxoacyl-[acyl-carrier-protein] synthase-3